MRRQWREIKAGLQGEKTHTHTKHLAEPEPGTTCKPAVREPSAKDGTGSSSR